MDHNKNKSLRFCFFFFCSTISKAIREFIEMERQTDPVGTPTTKTTIDQNKYIYISDAWIVREKKNYELLIEFESLDNLCSFSISIIIIRLIRIVFDK